MQLTADVAVPNALLQAARSGKLVLFIGAGASRNSPSDLPLFNGLAKRVAAALGEPYVETENPDAQLGDLESRHPSVKELVRAIIADKASRPNDTHRAIARLAAASGARIVSTNYDEHVETAARKEGIQLGREYYAPALPLGRDFDGLIYLHGSVSEDATTLVLTDQDFGRAYLTDGWARRFAHELFMNWTVLFIGYSHSDVVMTYLARGLPSGAQRYVLTSEPDHKRWRPLSITPVAYPPDDDHKALPAGLNAWADLMRMGQLDHYARVREIVSGAPPKEPEEIDYLVDAVTTSAGVTGFVSLARGYEWLRWAESQPGFKALFQPGRRSDVMAHVWGDWFVEHFVSEPANSGMGLSSVARLGPVLSEDLIWRIGRAQSKLHAASPKEAKRWDAALTAAVRSDGTEENSLWYQPYSNPYEGAALLPALRRALTPRLRLSEQRPWLPLVTGEEEDGDSNGPAGVSAEIQWSISEGSLRPLRERLGADLKQVAADVLQVAEQGLRDAYALLDAFEPDRAFDSWSFRRSAIEPHAQDQFPDEEDIVIDLLRDCGVFLARTDSSLKIRWLRSEHALFKRLGVHLLVEENTPADLRLAIILELSLVFDYDAKHEVFRFLATASPQLSPDGRRALLAAITAGPPHDGIDHDPSGRFDRRAVFDRLEWMQRFVTDWDELSEEIEAIRALEPDMGVRPHPDHDTWMESGTWGGKPPVTAEEFLNLIESQGPRRAIEAIIGRDYSERDFNEPTWDDAVRLVKETATAHPGFALRLYPWLRITPLKRHQDLISACFYGWADATLETHQIDEVLSLLGRSPFASDLARPVSAFILGTAKDLDKSNSADVLERLDQLAGDTWSTHAEAFEEPGWSDALMRGLNTWPGFLAQYWIQRISIRWQVARDQWNGLSPVEQDALRAMLPSAGPTSAMTAALGIIAADFAFLFAADRQFAIEELMPLFDVSESSCAPDVWFGFLHHPRTTPEMLDSGFWSIILKAEEVATSLTDRSVNEQYWRMIASIAAFSTATSVDRRDLVETFIRRPNQEALLRFLRALGSILHSEDPEASRETWARWLGDVMTLRFSLPPSVLSELERAAWGDLALDLGSRPAIELSAQAPGPILSRTRFSHLSEAFALENATLLITIATARLHQTAVVDWHVQHEVTDLVHRVGGSADRAALRALIETALSKGINDALTWMPPA